MGMFDGTDRYRVDGNSESDAQRDARRSQEKAMTLTAHPLKKTRIYWTATRCALVGLGGHSGYGTVGNGSYSSLFYHTVNVFRFLLPRLFSEDNDCKLSSSTMALLQNNGYSKAQPLY
jgi:hypothetical protein